MRGLPRSSLGSDRAAICAPTTGIFLLAAVKERSEALLEWLATTPDWVLYSLVGFVAALENLIPPFPSDVIVALGGAVAGVGSADPRILFLTVWLGNVSGALLVYWFGLRYGPGFFNGRTGRFLLAPSQVDALNAGYRRFGFPIIFFSRFLPVFRPIVPVFAGLARIGFWRTAVPMSLASAIWYGALVYFGALAGANWRVVLDTVDRFGPWLWIAAALVGAGVAWWWFRTRRPPGQRGRSDR